MSANAHIGSRHSLGIGFESTAGTKVSAEYWIPCTDLTVTPLVDKVRDTSGYGVIDENHGSDIVKQWTTTSATFIVRDEDIGAVLLPLFGTAAISGAGDYTHTFTRANTNNHKTVTLRSTDPVASYSSAYNMAVTATFEVVTDQYVKCTVEFIGKAQVSESTPTVTFASENRFLPTHAGVKFADTNAGISGASATDFESVTFAIAKNVADYQVIGSVDVDTFFNQYFAVTGSLSGLYANTTIRDYMTNNTEKFMELELLDSTTTLAGGGNPTITFTLASLDFENWNTEGGQGDIRKESVDFTANYSLSDAYTAKAEVINERSTAYGS